MTEGKRPGGLTALAVFNFIFGAFGVLGILAMIAMFAIFSSIEVDEASTQELKRALEEMGIGMLVVLVGISIVSTVLIFAAGVGYLKQKKFLGRTLGNVWAGLNVLSSVLTGLMLPIAAGGGFNIGTIVGLIYPVLTLILLNVTFKDDLVN
jgi:hypothetical protein